MRREQTNHRCEIIINNLDALPSRGGNVYGIFFLGKKCCVLYIYGIFSDCLLYLSL